MKSDYKKRKSKKTLCGELPHHQQNARDVPKFNYDINKIILFIKNSCKMLEMMIFIVFFSISF